MNLSVSQVAGKAAKARALPTTLVQERWSTPGHRPESLVTTALGRARLQPRIRREARPEKSKFIKIGRAGGPKEETRAGEENRTEGYGGKPIGPLRSSLMHQSPARTPPAPNRRNPPS